MQAARLRQVYATLLDEVEAGGFGPPPAGQRSVEQTVAHLVANDELLIEVTEAVLAGSPWACYDPESIHGTQLDAMISEYGGLGGLVTLLRVTSRQLCTLVDRLGTRGGTPVRTRIREGFTLVIDDTLPWERVLDIHGRLHLPAHIEQLRALRTG